MWIYLNLIVELITAAILFLYINNRNQQMNRTVEAANRKIQILAKRVEILEQIIIQCRPTKWPENMPMFPKMNKIFEKDIPPLETLNNESREEDDENPELEDPNPDLISEEQLEELEDPPTL